MRRRLLNIITQTDISILDYIYNNLRCPFLNGFFSFITHFGDGGIFWIILALILLIFKKTRKTGAMIGVALVLGLLICNIAVKPLVARIRPYDLKESLGFTIDVLVSRPTDFSFPSGHTVACFEGACVIFSQNKKWGIPALVLAVLVALSRLYLYIHYPTDVLAGMVIGIVDAVLAVIIVNAVIKKYKSRKQQTLEK